MAAEGEHGILVLDAAQRAIAQDLLDRLQALRSAVLTGSAARMRGWANGEMRDAFRGPAGNLADWLALREIDLSPLQPLLTQFGLSTLGRLEGHVRPTIDAVIAALAAITGAEPARFPAAGAVTGAAARLARERDALFGEGEPNGPHTRIMVTLPTEAADDPGLVARLADEGMDCVRINCAHDGPEIWARMIAHVRAAADRAGRRVPVSMDLGGPKFRISDVAGRSDKPLGPGDAFAIALTKKAAPRGMPCAVLSHSELVDALVMNTRISIDDGKLWATVVKLRDDHAVLRVDQAPAKGLKLKAEKGVNLPGSDLRVSALTDEDLAALDFVVGQADVVSYSFVQTVGDVRTLIAAMRARAGDGKLPAVVLKIETPKAVRNLPDLIVEAGRSLPVGVMIARGDLAVEIGFERLSEIQEEILWLCEAAQVPVIWATQVLEGMIRNGQASRAEVTDAAMSQRAECVMLNKGPNIVEAVRFLTGILARMDRHQHKKRARLGPLRSWVHRS